MLAKKENAVNGKAKLKVSLLIWEFVKEMLRVRRFGSEKYGAWDWQKGRMYSEYFDPAQRHINKWFFERDQRDDESGLHHLAHAAVNLMFLYWFEMTGRKALDDRPIMTDFQEAVADLADTINKG